VTTTLQQLHPNSEPEWVDEPIDGVWPAADVITALQDLRIHVVESVNVIDLIDQGRF
jgi:hypothetical protein